MELGWQTIARLRGQIAALAPRQRLLLATAVLASLFGLGMVLALNGAGRDEPLLGGRVLSEQELRVARGALQASGLTRFRVESGRIMVPQADAARCTAAVSSALAGSGRKPRHLDDALGTDLISTLRSSMLSESERQARVDRARAHDLEEDICRLHREIEYVSVNVDRGRGGWNSRQQKMTATLIVVPRPDSAISAEIEESLRRLVRQWYSGLSLDDVAVHWRSSAADAPAVADSSVPARMPPDRGPAARERKRPQAESSAIAQIAGALGTLWNSRSAALRHWASPLAVAAVSAGALWSLRRKTRHQVRRTAVSGHAISAASPGPVSDDTPRADLGHAAILHRQRPAHVPGERIAAAPPAGEPAEPATTSLAFLHSAGPARLAAVLEGEHAQTTAVVLAHLPAELAAETLACFAPTDQLDVVRRIATMAPIDSEVIRDLFTSLETRLLGMAQPSVAPRGVAAAARLLHLAAPGNPAILTELEREHAGLARQIRRMMFTFNDLTLLDAGSLRVLFHEIPPAGWVLALKGSASELKRRLLRAFPRTAARALQDELDDLAPVRIGDVETAQQQVLEAVARLQAAGRIVMPVPVQRKVA